MSRLALLLLGVAGALVGLAGEAVAFGWYDPRRWLPDLMGVDRLGVPG